MNETEAEIVRQMYRWLIEEALSSYAIAKRLQERGVPARQGRGWWQSTVIEVLRDPLYKGEGFYNRTGPDRSMPTAQRAPTGSKTNVPAIVAVVRCVRVRSGSPSRCP